VGLFEALEWLPWLGFGCAPKKIRAKVSSLPAVVPV
jgi:hypothetical protein